eukprot:TRINITY_DN359_c0_g1_i1.p1 TRINITY_DN359_c0_g1~~TRINITY_DN359_c0_g1_i1.p1  ORF type:complete len:1147 (-),score=223.14 TRINITY_DN359_c0_g1_i1:835-4248(-)
MAIAKLKRDFQDILVLGEASASFPGTTVLSHMGRIADPADIVLKPNDTVFYLYHGPPVKLCDLAHADDGFKWHAKKPLKGGKDCNAIKGMSYACRNTDRSIMKHLWFVPPEGNNDNSILELENQIHIKVIVAYRLSATKREVPSQQSIAMPATTTRVVPAAQELDGDTYQPSTSKRRRAAEARPVSPPLTRKKTAAAAEEATDDMSYSPHWSTIRSPPQEPVASSADSPTKRMYSEMLVGLQRTAAQKRYPIKVRFPKLPTFTFYLFRGNTINIKKLVAIDGLAWVGKKVLRSKLGIVGISYECPDKPGLKKRIWFLQSEQGLPPSSVPASPLIGFHSGASSPAMASTALDLVLLADIALKDSPQIDTPRTPASMKFFGTGPPPPSLSLLTTPPIGSLGPISGTASPIMTPLLGNKHAMTPSMYSAAKRVKTPVGKIDYWGSVKVWHEDEATKQSYMAYLQGSQPSPIVFDHVIQPSIDSLRPGQPLFYMLQGSDSRTIKDICDADGYGPWQCCGMLQKDLHIHGLVYQCRNYPDLKKHIFFTPENAPQPAATLLRSTLQVAPTTNVAYGALPLIVPPQHSGMASPIPHDSHPVDLTDHTFPSTLPTAPGSNVHSGVAPMPLVHAPGMPWASPATFAAAVTAMHPPSHGHSSSHPSDDVLMPPPLHHGHHGGHHHAPPHFDDVHSADGLPPAAAVLHAPPPVAPPSTAIQERNSVTASPMVPAFLSPLASTNSMYTPMHHVPSPAMLLAAHQAVQQGHSPRMNGSMSHYENLRRDRVVIVYLRVGAHAALKSRPLPSTGIVAQAERSITDMQQVCVADLESLRRGRVIVSYLTGSISEQDDIPVPIPDAACFPDDPPVVVPAAVKPEPVATIAPVITVTPTVPQPIPDELVTPPVVFPPSFASSTSELPPPLPTPLSTLADVMPVEPEPVVPMDAQPTSNADAVGFHDHAVTSENDDHDQSMSESEADSPSDDRTARELSPRDANRQLDTASVTKMRNWFDEHFEYPQPSRQQLEELCAESSLTRQRVKKWIDNAKQRTNGPWRAMRSRGRPVKRAIEVMQLYDDVDPIATLKVNLQRIHAQAPDVLKTHNTIIRATSDLIDRLAKLPSSAGQWQHPRGGGVVVLRTAEVDPALLSL